MFWFLASVLFFEAFTGVHKGMINKKLSQMNTQTGTENKCKADKENYGSQNFIAENANLRVESKILLFISF